MSSSHMAQQFILQDNQEILSRNEFFKQEIKLLFDILFFNLSSF